MRSLRRHGLLTVFVVLTLGFGVGAAATMCGLVDFLLFRPPAYVKRPERVVWVPRAQNYIEFSRLTQQVSSVDVAAFSRSTLPSGSEAESLTLGLECVTLNYFQVLGVDAVAGRTFAPDRDAASGENLAVVSSGLWQRRFAGHRPGDARLTLGGRTFAVVGVLPPGFFGMQAAPVDVWLPLTGSPDLCAFTGTSLLASSGSWLKTVGRVRDPFSLAQAEAELAVALGDAPAGDTRSALEPLLAPRWNRLTRESRMALWSSGAALLVLLIAAVTVTVFMALSAIERRLEVALRLQLGGTKGRVFRTLLAENMVLTGACLVTAVIAAWWVQAAVGAILPLPAAGPTQVRSLAMVLAFAGIATISSAVIPAVQVLRVNTVGMLRTGQHVVPQRTGIRGALLVSQLALAQALLTTGALFVQSVGHLTSGAGFDIEHTLVVTLEPEKFNLSPADGWLAAEEMAARVRSLTGVTHVAASSAPLLGSGGSGVSVGVRPSLAPTNTLTSTFTMNAVTPEYFTALGTRLIEGRAFSVADRADTRLVGIVDRSFASAQWPDQPPLGRCLFVAASRACIEVVGISENRRPGMLTMSRREFFVPASQAAGFDLHTSPRTLLVRVTGRTRERLPGVVAAVRSVIAEVPGGNVRPLSDLADEQTRSWRLGADVFRILGVLTAILAVAGLYGALTVAIRQRAAEIAVRVALGATPSHIAAMLARSTALQVGAAWLLGLLLTALLSRPLHALLFGVSATDVATVMTVSLLMLAVAVAGTLVPLRRATRLNTWAALREG